VAPYIWRSFNSWPPLPKAEDTIMAKVEIYASMWCGFCHRAKALLNAKGVEFIEYDVDSDASGRRDMMARGGGSTVPQIFIDDKPIGGCDELYALEGAGRLDALLGAPSPEESRHG
jgi:glutaredoxin 3